MFFSERILKHLHRPLCRPSGQGRSEDRFAGHGAPINLFQSFNDWVKETHDYTFMTLMCATVQLRGGIDANFASPRVVVFKLTQVDEPKTPAGAFRLSPEVPLILNREDLDRDNWEDLDAACQRQAEGFRTGPNPHPCYIGSLPAMIWVQSTSIAAFQPFPIYRLRIQGTGPINPLTSVVFEQVVTLCITMLNAGFVLRGPEGLCGLRELLPEVGVLVKRKKKWEWRKQEGWAWNRAVHLPSGMEPEMLWQMFYVL